LKQFAIALYFNTVYEQIMHASWLIGSEALAIGGKINDSTNRSRSNGVSIKDYDVGDGADS
jgi:hypothetical protein